MLNRPFKSIVVIAVIACLGLDIAWARDTVTITLPRHSQLTYVQRLNREGVMAVQKHDLVKAADLFYKAYLYDPADPFTLNNLGYVSEMEGQLDRAGQFYNLAEEQGCNASIEVSNVKGLEGKPMNTAFADIQEGPMQVNRINMDAMRLISENRGSEAINLLEHARTLDPQNPFTLNNLGVAEEAIGEYDSAMKYYAAAERAGSAETIIVTDDRSWQGKSVREMATANIRRLQSRMGGANSASSRAVMLNQRGVLAENQNNWGAAKEDFLKAYSLDPSNAFSLNNRGYVAEKDGDLESAQFFYEKALKADGAGVRVGLATNHSAEGQPLSQSATDSDQKVGSALETYSRERRQQSAPIELIPRDGGSNATPEQPSSPSVPPPSTGPQMPQ